MKVLPGVLLSLGVSSAVFADVVEKVEYAGLDRVEEAAISDAVLIKPNKNYDKKDVAQSIRNLYEKDFFSNIEFFKKGNTLVIKVKEKPIVDKVVFEGNDAGTDEMLNSVVNGRLGEGRLFSSHVVKDVLADMQLAYKAWGFYFSEINPQYIERSGNKIDIVFNIKEGRKTTVAKIIFIGNKTFSDDQLKDVISMKEARVWRFWDYDSQIYREDKVDVDIDAITKFYKSKGFPFFVVTSSHAEMSSDKQSHFCTFIMDEGDKYNIRDISLTSEISDIKADDYKSYIKFKSDDVYNESLIYEVRDKIRKEVSLKGNSFINVTVDIHYDKEKNLADVFYKIVKSQKVFVERIEIVGNTRTLDKVIRRELSVHEGDALNAYKIQRSIDRLKAMDYFDDVQVREEDGSSDDKKVIVVSVKEKDSTAQIRFGLSVNDSDGFGGFVGFIENNLMGTGKVLSADVMWMQQYHGAKIDLFDPRFFDQNIGAGIKLGVSDINRKKFENAAVRSFYVGPYIRYSINENLIHRIGYSVSFNRRKFWNRDFNKWTNELPDSYTKDDKIIKFRNKDIWQEEYGKYTNCELSSVLTYFDVDNPYDRRYGYDISLTNAYSGLMGNVKYFKNVLEGNLYRPVTEKVTFVLNGQVGHIKEISNTRSCDRFTLGGGSTMRGFNSYGIGARAIESGEIVYDKNGKEIDRRDAEGNSLGSTKYWTVSLMLKAPLSTKEMGINGVVFLDFGSAWGSKYPRSKVNDSSAIRASTGVAIEWAKCPLGMPMSFVFGFALKKKHFDDKQVFTLTGLM
ncbi:MAG: outer membrane protein assembly factor BamA [Alphaproteobacteria bacterium]|nr:outer membrane protein assembly factor BamA [Alphaproteobacteria bacterium]